MKLNKEEKKYSALVLGLVLYMSSVIGIVYRKTYLYSLYTGPAQPLRRVRQSPKVSNVKRPPKF